MLYDKDVAIVDKLIHHCGIVRRTLWNNANLSEMLDSLLDVFRHEARFRQFRPENVYTSPIPSRHIGFKEQTDDLTSIHRNNYGTTFYPVWSTSNSSASRFVTG